MVSIPTNDVLIFNLVYKSCLIEISRKELEVDLILLWIKDFNVILGMDWLTADHTNVDYYNKKVVFKFPYEKPFSS